MKESFKNKHLVLKYTTIFVWVFFVVLVNLFIPEMPLTLLTILMSLWLLPGFFLAKIFKIEIKNDLLGQIILWMSLGLVFALGLSLAGIALGVTLGLLTIIYLVLISLLFVLSYIFESKSTVGQGNQEFKLSLKKVFTAENLIYILILVVVSLVILVLLKKGALFKGGDPNYHLATIRKVISGQPLTIDNLNYVKDKIQIAYGFPIWHVFIGILVKITGANIFGIWRDLAIILAVPVFMVWFWLCRKIMPSRFLGSLALLLFVVFSFYWESGYLYTTLPIPHTLTQLLFLPLLVVLAAKIIFDKSKLDYKLFTVLIILTILAAAVHLTVYFYFLFILFSLTIFYPIFNFKQEFFKLIYKKIVLLLGASLGIVIPLALALEIKNHTISANFSSFKASDYPTKLKFDDFADYGPFSKYAYMALPLIFIFVKKYRNLMIALAVLLITPIIYWSVISTPLVRAFGYILMKRLYANLEWHFLIWSLVLGFLLLIIDRLISYCSKTKQYVRYIIDIILLTMASLLVWAQFKYNWAVKVFDSMISDKTNAFQDKNHLWFIAVFSILAIVLVLISKKNKKIDDYLTINEPRNYLSQNLLVFMIVFILFSPNYELFIQSIKKNNFKYFVRPTLSVANAKVEYYDKYAGGAEDIKFINTKLPPKSVFDTNVAYFILPIVVDQHMPVYHSQAAVEHSDLYLEETSLKRRLQILSDYKIDYLYVKYSKGDPTVMDSLPQYFTKIYQNYNTIYQVNKVNVQKDSINKK